MANRYDEGRADRAAGARSIDTPEDPHAWGMFKTDEQVRDQEESNATWREGWHDKDQEIREAKER